MFVFLGTTKMNEAQKSTKLRLLDNGTFTQVGTEGWYSCGSCIVKAYYTKSGEGGELYGFTIEPDGSYRSRGLGCSGTWYKKEHGLN